MRKSQKSRILAYLKSGKRITPAIAYIKFGSLRLSERCREIMADGHAIKKAWHKTAHSRVMSYWL